MGVKGRDSSSGIDAIYQYVGTGVQVISALVFYFIITRFFTLTEVGAIALFLAIVGLFSIIFTLGMNVAAQHFISYSLSNGDYLSTRGYLYNILKIALLTSLLGFILLFAISPLLSILLFHSVKFLELIQLLSFDIVGIVLFSVLNGILLGLRKFQVSAIISIVVWIVYYIGPALFLILNRSVDIIVIGWILAMFLGVIMTIYIISKEIKLHVMTKYPNVAPRNFRLIFAFSTPVLFSTIISYGATYADRFIVAGLVNLNEMGVYNLTLLIASGLAFLTAPFNNILITKFSELFAKNQKMEIRGLVRSSSLFLSSIFVPAALLTAALSNMIIGFIAGTAYLGGSIPLNIILFFSSVFIMRSIFIPAVTSVRQTKSLTYSSIAAISTNILLSLLLIPKWSLVGAALGFSSVYVSNFFVLFYYVNREQVFSFDVKGMLKIWIAASIMYGIIEILLHFAGNHEFLLPIYLVTGVSLYLIVIRVLKLFDLESKNFILYLFPIRYRLLRTIILKLFIT